MRFAGLSVPAGEVAVGPFAMAFVAADGLVPRGAIVVSLPVVVDVVDDVLPPDGDVLVEFGDIDVEEDDVPGVAVVEEPGAVVAALPADVPGDVVPSDDVPGEPDPVVDDVPCAFASIVPVIPIVETINPETSLLFKRRFIVGLLGNRGQRRAAARLALCKDFAALTC
jgi:hypothetical protein